MIYSIFCNITNVTTLYMKKQMVLSKWYEVLPEEDAERTETYRADLVNVHWIVLLNI
jgi:hypothetical protein